MITKTDVSNVSNLEKKAQFHLITLEHEAKKDMDAYLMNFLTEIHSICEIGYNEFLKQQAICNQNTNETNRVATSDTKIYEKDEALNLRDITNPPKNPSNYTSSELV